MKLVVFLLITTMCIGCGQAMDAKRELKISVSSELPQGARGPVCGCGGKEIKGAEMQKALNSLINKRR
jgi:hypothetical protein